MHQVIGLLDCNNFFVSCERLFRPDLANRPVVVLSSNDGCVVARSQEVKDLGIPMGVPFFKVKKELQAAGAVHFSSNFALYRDLSQRVMAVLATAVPEMEQYSIDEAFFVLPAGTEDEMGDFLTHIRTRIEREVGIPVSIGAARTKTLAKVANKIAKSGPRVYVLSDSDWTQRAPDVQLAEIWGVGSRMSLRYRAHELITAADLMSANSNQIATLFGVAGTRLQHELNGRPVGAVSPKRQLQKSVMSSRSFAATTDVPVALEQAVIYHCEQVAAQLRAMQAAAGRVSAYVRPSRYSDYALRTAAVEVVFDIPTNDTARIIRAVIDALRPKLQEGVPYKKAGVAVGEVVPEGVKTSSLFAESATTDSTLMRTLDSLTKKFGHEAIHYAGANRLAARGAHAFNSGSKTTSWRDIPRVKAN